MPIASMVVDDTAINGGCISVKKYATSINSGRGISVTQRKAFDIRSLIIQKHTADRISPDSALLYRWRTFYYRPLRSLV